MTGKLVIVGLFGGELTVPLPPIPMRAVTIQGSYVGSIPEMAELMDQVRRTGPPQVPVATALPLPPSENPRTADGIAHRPFQRSQ